MAEKILASVSSAINAIEAQSASSRCQRQKWRYL